MLCKWSHAEAACSLPSPWEKGHLQASYMGSIKRLGSCISQSSQQLSLGGNRLNSLPQLGPGPGVLLKITKDEQKQFVVKHYRAKGSALINEITAEDAIYQQHRNTQINIMPPTAEIHMSPSNWMNSVPFPLLFQALSVPLLMYKTKPDRST